jgi:hypothetical protein
VTAVEFGEPGGEERHAGARKAGEAKLASLEAGDRGELVLGLLEARHRRLGVDEQGPPGVGELRPVTGPLEQVQPDLPLEARHLLADRRLREIELIRGAGERPAAGHLAEHV